MKSIRNLVWYIAISVMCTPAFSQGYHVRIGTIGNSITHGNSLPNPLTQAYPVVLDGLLPEVYGDTCIVKNFGLTTTTMLKNGDVSYWDTQHLKDYLAFAPEICFIMLGTNDTKPYNWDVYGDEFIGDYLSMMDTIKARNPSTRFMLAYPPPAFAVVWDIRDSIIVNGVIPAVDSIAKLEDVEIMDFYHPLLDSVHLFPDKIHPNIAGNIVMAKLLRDRIIETDIIHKADTGLTFITGFKTNRVLLPLNESAELSWTTINADTVFINGELVEKEGNMSVSPPETTTYTMLAKGQVRNDTGSITLEVYVQELARLRISPSWTTRNVGDTVFFQAFHYDQMDLPITRNYPDVTWNLEGSGSLYQETDTSVFFICEIPADTSYLEVSYNGDFAAQSRIVTRPYATGIAEKTEPGDFIIYPNPGHDIINIRAAPEDGSGTISIFDMKGALHLQKEFLPVAGQNVFEFKINDLASGVYIIQVSNHKVMYSERLLIDKK